LRLGGASGALAQYVAALLVGGWSAKRPALPALALGTDAARAAVARAARRRAGQVTRWAAPGDLLVLSPTAATNLLRAAAGRARQGDDRDRCSPAVAAANCVKFAGRDRRPLIACRTSAPRVLEAHQLVLHCLCDADRPATAG
jgi:D-sedoheptulose 7-phosphate isomerase